MIISLPIDNAFCKFPAECAIFSRDIDYPWVFSQEGRLARTGLFKLAKHIGDALFS